MKIRLTITALVASFSLLAAGLLAPVATFAQNPAEQICKGSGGTWNGSECTKAGTKGLFEADGVFQTVVNTMLFVIGAIAVIMLIIGAIRYVVSAGDSNAVQGAKNTILYAIVGIVVAFMAWGILNFVVNSLK